jgi:L-ribulokinase
MNLKKYSLGIDFGTESGRAVLVDISNGAEIATAIYTVLRESGVNPRDIIGVGVDFTACTMLPTKKDGTPLCFIPEFRSNPHAWVKLWKHHAAQPEANRLNEIAQSNGFKFLKRYGGKISSEWFVPKVWQILNDAPEIYVAAERFLEATDWVVWQLTGIESRNSCTAGYKAIWSKREGFPEKAFYKALDPRLENFVDEKMSRVIFPLGQKAGGITAQAAAWTGLLPDTAVAVANVDAHVAVPASTVVEPGRMVIIMGTSNCHMVLSDQERVVPGMCGYVEDGIIPGYFGYEAGQSCVGDHFAWFVENCVPASYHKEAEQRGINIHHLLEEKASQLSPGKSGLIALDWWNGNRSVLVDVELSGLIVGLTLATKPEEIYRALIEATAYGTRVIVEAFQQHDVPVNEIVATGGLPDKNHLLMQIYADVTGMPVKVAAAKQTPALGAAMFGAVAAGKSAGGYVTIYEASQFMAHLRDEVYTPYPKSRQMYNRLFAEYRLLHDIFGRGVNDVMKRLKALRAEQIKT